MKWRVIRGILTNIIYRQEKESLKLAQSNGTNNALLNVSGIVFKYFPKKLRLFFHVYYCENSRLEFLRQMDLMIHIKSFSSYISKRR